MDTPQCFRFFVGSVTCLAVADGTDLYDDPGELLFANASAAERAAALRAHGLPSPWLAWRNTYAPLVIDTGAEPILIDTGTGAAVPTAGRLLANLDAAGVTPDMIATVVLTHAHPDHIGAPSPPTKLPPSPMPAISSAKREWAFWCDEEAVAQRVPAEEMREAFLGCVRTNLEPLGDRLQMIDDGTQVAPGVRVAAAPGHTPGHLVVEVTSDGERLLILGDAVAHPIHLEHPDWHCLAGIDAVPEAVEPTRRRLLREPPRRTPWCMAFTSIRSQTGGCVVPRGDAWSWKPLVLTLP